MTLDLTVLIFQPLFVEPTFIYITNKLFDF